MHPKITLRQKTNSLFPVLFALATFVVSLCAQAAWPGPDDMLQSIKLHQSASTLTQTDFDLIKAILTKNAAAARDALKAGANPNAMFTNTYKAGKSTCLTAAIEEKNMEILRLLLEAGARVEAPPGAEPWSHPLTKAQNLDYDPAIFDLLLDYCKKSPSSDEADGYALALFAEVRSNNTARIERLRQLGANFAYVSKNGGCLPLAALEGGHFALADELIEQHKERLRSSPRKLLNPGGLLEAAAGRPHREAEFAEIVNELNELGFIFRERDQWNTSFVQRAANARLPLIARALGMTDEAELAKIKPYTAEMIIRRAARLKDNKEFATVFDQYTTSETRRQMATLALGYSLTPGHILAGNVFIKS